MKTLTITLKGVPTFKITCQDYTQSNGVYTFTIPVKEVLDITEEPRLATGKRLNKPEL